MSCIAGDVVLICDLGKSLGEGNDNPFWYSYLGNPMDRGAWRATVNGVTKRVGCDLVNKINNNNNMFSAVHSMFCYYIDFV